MELNFYRCKHCGQIVAVVKKTGVPLVCCGEKMERLVPGSVDASLEKHVPVIETKGNLVTVTVGAAEHPMQEEHYIEWIVLCTKEGNQRKALCPGEAPRALFALAEGDEAIAALALCNLHGLWEAKA